MHTHTRLNYVILALRLTLYHETNIWVMVTSQGERESLSYASVAEKQPESPWRASTGVPELLAGVPKGQCRGSYAPVQGFL